MNDSQFSVAIFLTYCVLCALLGAFIHWYVFNGLHECSVTMEYEGSHKVEYVTECEVMR